MTTQIELEGMPETTRIYRAREYKLVCLRETVERDNPEITTPEQAAAYCKKLALEIAQAIRAQKFERVGKSFLDRIEAKARAAIAEEVRIHPSKGKTLL